MNRRRDPSQACHDPAMNLAATVVLAMAMSIGSAIPYKPLAGAA
jgi:hypothetical protein